MEIIREFQKFKKLISDVRNHISQSNINRFVRRIIWNNYVYRDINISQDDKISDNYNWFVDKLIPLTEKWNLVNNSIEFFTVDNHMHSNFGRVKHDVRCRFRLSDVVKTSNETGHDPMPEDIKREWGCSNPEL